MMIFLLRGYIEWEKPDVFYTRHKTRRVSYKANSSASAHPLRWRAVTSGGGGRATQAQAIPFDANGQEGKQAYEIVTNCTSTVNYMN